MVDTNANVPEGDVQGQPVSSDGSGQPAEDTTSVEPTTNAGEAGDTASENGEPTGEGLFDGMTPEQLHTSYKNLQREFTTKSEGLSGLNKNFERFGGAEKATEFLEFLSGNESFAEWVKQEQQAQITGVNNADPETQQAIEMVKKIAQAEISNAMKQQVEPLADSYKQRLITENMKAMDGKYPNWRDMQNTMADIAETLPPEVQDNPSLADLETLYVRSLIETGKFDDFAKSKYEATLNAAKAKSTTKPTTTTGGITRASTIEAAFEMAKRQHNK